MCNKILAPWPLPCSPPQRRIFTRGFRGNIAVCSPDWFYSWNAADAVLDGGDSRLPQTAQFRARVLFSLPLAFPFLQWIATRDQCADLLYPAERSAAELCRRSDLHRTRVSAFCAFSSAHRVCGDPKNGTSAAASASCDRPGIFAADVFCAAAAAEHLAKWPI